MTREALAPLALLLSIASLIYSAVYTFNPPRSVEAMVTKTITERELVTATKTTTATTVIREVSRTTETQYRLLTITERELVLPYISVEDASLFLDRIYLDTLYYSIVLLISIKASIYNDIYILNITVDEHPVAGFTPVHISPGDIFTGAYPIIIDLETGNTRVRDLPPEWGSGTVHTIYIYYRIDQQGEIRVISVKAEI